MMGTAAGFFSEPPAGGGGFDLYAALLDRASTEKISCAHQSSISLSGDLSLELWINLDIAVPSGSHMFLCSKASGSFASDGWSMWLTDDGFGSHILNWLTGNGAGAYQHVTWTWNPSATTWYHVALTYDVSQAQADEATLYIDTVDQGAPGISNANNFSSIGTNTDPLVWGELDGLAFDGKMCEIRLWDHVRTSTQISDNHDASVAADAAGLVCYIPNDGSSAVDDVSDSALSVTATGVTLSNASLPF